MDPRGFFKTASVACLLAALAAGCTKKSSDSTPDAAMTPEQNSAKLIALGRGTYLSNCTACHNPDPRKDGAVGPAIWGSSLELVQKRVMEAAYPAGYKPKRDTHQMAALPHLKPDIPAIHAYLNSADPATK